MSECERIEQEILDVLATETRAIPLSNRLFGPAGFFGQLAQTADQRRSVAQSPLFKQAQKRVLELQRNEAGEFSRAVDQTPAAMLGENFLIKLENTESK